MRDETDKEDEEDRTGASHLPGEGRDNSSEKSPYTVTRHVREVLRRVTNQQMINDITNP